MLDELRQKPFSMLQAIFIRDSLTSPLALYALTNCFFVIKLWFFLSAAFFRTHNTHHKVVSECERALEID